MRTYISARFSHAGEDGRSKGVNEDLLLYERVQQQRHAVLRAEILQQSDVRCTTACWKKNKLKSINKKCLNEHLNCAF